MADTSIEVLSFEECVAQLRAGSVGRLAFTHGTFPVVFPVNYRLVEDERGIAVVVRTRPGNVLDRAPREVAFQIDGIDPAQRIGWSVLVQGRLRHLAPPDEATRGSLDPQPWAGGQRDSWLAIEPMLIGGRRLRHPDAPWAFEPAAYL